MIVRKAAVFLILSLGLGELTLAQPTPQDRDYNVFYQGWTFLSLRNDISSDFGIELSTFHWRQNVTTDNLNIYEGYQLQAYELYLHYYYSKDFVFSIAPAYFHQETLADDGWQSLGEPQHEYRIIAHALNSLQYGNLNLVNRLGFEYRHRSSSENPGVYWPENRIMYRIQLNYGFADNWKAIFQNEVFLAFGRYIQFNLLNLNIAFVGFQYIASEHVQVNFGYSHYFETLRSGNEFNMSHALNLGLTLNNLIKWKRKDQN
jgi:hypothetical protein